jgi:P pilus assembly chaperone PapD
MRKVVLFVLMLTGLVLAACSAGEAQIALETTRIDLGDVVNGEIVTRDVAVQNMGNRDLVVEAVSTSCGCTKATLDPMMIAPGAQGTLHIEFDSGAHGEELNGELVRQIFIATNDPAQPETMLELTANVLPPGSS